MQLVSDTVSDSRQFEDFAIIFKAENIRRERTGVHARLSVLIEGVVLAWDVFNIERNGERSRLAGAAHKGLASTPALKYPQSELKHDLDEFCDKVWPAVVADLAPMAVAGDPVGCPVEYLAEPHVLTEAGTILYAPPGSLKSYTALAIAVAVDAGANDLWVTKQAKSLYVNLERGPTSIQRRIGHVNTALGLDPDRPMLVLNARGRSLADVKDAVRVAVDNQGVELVVVDSISRAGFGDLKEDRSANAVIDTLNRLAPSWLCIGHTPRSDESHVFGSVLFEAGADVMVKQSYERREAEVGVALEVTKSNDTAIPPMFFLAYTFDQFGLQLARKAKPQDYPSLVAQGKMSLGDQIYAYLVYEVGSDTATNIAAKLGADRSRVTHVLREDQRFIPTQKTGREQFYGVRQVPSVS